MKIKVLCRNPDEYLRETKRDIHKVQRNFDPALHPFEAAREYVRALNSVKLDRVFAKPFIGSLDGHRDGILCIAKHPKKLSTVMSGSGDGEIRQWDISQQTCVRTIQAHTGLVQGMCCTQDGETFLSVGHDMTIKQWKMEPPGWEEAEEPINTIVAKTTLTGINHHWKEPTFATCGERVDIWDESRAAPLRSFTWGVDSHSCVRFNPVETNLLGSCANDRSIILYDTREAHPLRKVVLQMCSNSICWNPMEAFVFTAANEDFNLYTFDLRRLNCPLNVHMDHVSSVMDVDYSPTGKEFVTGSYDKTVRIFPLDKGHSREVYHTKRMQRVKKVLWSLDNRYILSASDEMNIRVWKANSSEKLGLLHSREKTAFNYSEKLKEKYAHHPEVKRIVRHRHVPKHVLHAKKELRAVRESDKKKEANRRAHSKPGSVPYVSEREKHVVNEQE